MSKEIKVSWGHQGTIGKFHVDLYGPGKSQSHHHSPTLNPPPTNEYGHIKIKGTSQLPAPYGPIK